MVEFYEYEGLGYIVDPESDTKQVFIPSSADDDNSKDQSASGYYLYHRRKGKGRLREVRGSEKLCRKKIR